MKKHKGKIIFFVVFLLILAAAFFTHNKSGDTVSDVPYYTESSAEDVNILSACIPDGKDEKTTYQNKDEGETSVYFPQSTSSAQNIGSEEQNDKDGEMKCFLSVRCDAVLKNLSKLKKEKQDIIPADGIIYSQQAVVIYEGDSVFDVLLREMRKNKIHLEFENTPVYNSSYIEGISNLYEFDCGPLSGWTFKVNGVFPAVGSSQLEVNDGDRIEWVYTCDMGKDVGK